MRGRKKLEETVQSVCVCAWREGLYYERDRGGKREREEREERGGERV